MGVDVETPFIRVAFYITTWLAGFVWQNAKSEKMGFWSIHEWWISLLWTGTISCERALHNSNVKNIMLQKICMLLSQLKIERATLFIRLP
jgi:hypothetical protein